MAANDLGICGLPHCWVCGRRFSDSGGSEQREEHHIVPRQAGGTDGPQVSLCDTHHTKVHRIEERMAASKPFFDFLQGEGPEQQKKLIWLATRARNAFALTDDDPNKLKFAQVTIDARKHMMIQKLKKVYPKARSREAILTLALESLYRKHFTH
jgi:hypothetical protein